MKYQKETLSTFSGQILNRLEKYNPHNLRSEDFNNVVICGLGGSGIGGQIAKSYFYELSPLPIETVSRYSLPKYVNSKTLIIIGSYSGNTEETISLSKQAQLTGAKIIVLTAGGELKELGEKMKWPVYHSEPGLQPRMALGYSLTNLMLILEEFFQLPIASKIKLGSQKVKDYNLFLENGRKLFEESKTQLNSSFVILADSKFEPIATRFAQQIQENAKLEAFVNVLPEANHNVIETYHSKSPNTYFLLDSKSNTRTTDRFNFVKNLLKKNGNLVIEIPVNGTEFNDWLEIIFTLDWTSLWMADSLDRESENVPIIWELKNYLAGRE